MGQFANAIKGMSAACVALAFPVVSGNVSLYNETEGRGILPTPAIGGLGVLENAAQAIGMAPAAGLDLVLVGATAGHLGQSLWLREIAKREDGPPPPVDLAAERRNGDFVRGEILAGRVRACHDVSDGGTLIAVVEMALAGEVGIDLLPRHEEIAPHAFWFGEDQSRYIVAVPDAAAFLAAAKAADVPATRLGRTGGAHLTLPGGATISLDALRRAHERFLPAWMDNAGQR